MKRSKFNLSHTQLHTMAMGQLVPVGLTEVIPGDTIQHTASALIRCIPMYAPVMHPVRISIRHFFVPFRLLWDNWEDFITGGPDGMDDSVFPTIPYDRSGLADLGGLGDHLGVPTGNTQDVSALPFRAYALIYNEFFRDQDLVTPLAVDTGDGDDNTTNIFLRNAPWEKDYFTTSRPWEQKGPTVTLPFGQEAPVSATQVTRTSGGAIETIVRGTATNPDNSGSVDMTGANLVPDGDPLTILGTADLSQASAVDINTLRVAFALQRYQEARARFGSRYTEYLRYLGVRSSDARLQRPEYLGGARTSMQFSEVLSTSAASPGPEETGGVAAMAGHGIGSNRTNRYRRFFEEHGYVMTLMSVIPQTMYPDGLFRTWLKRTKEDFFQKELQHIGQQPVMTAEVCATDTENSGGLFGYQDRYDEYRRSESQVHGLFRTLYSDWHFGRMFGGVAPALNGQFVQSNPRTDAFQIQSAEDYANLLVGVRHQMVARRLLAQKGSSFIL